MDACNSRFGRGAVMPARAGLVETRTLVDDVRDAGTAVQRGASGGRIHPCTATRISIHPSSVIRIKELCRRQPWVASPNSTLSPVTSRCALAAAMSATLSTAS
ncbi:hypothetical protein [Methylobacterium tarhaniae]|uniref:hypothetical protein n=1 Tax=Methylobacterium tarhaniae TaxID=1187852 RepID=UPI00315A4E86